MKCELCEKEKFLKIFEGLEICIECRYKISPPMPRMSRRRPVRSMNNIHLNGNIAADPRPYGQRP